MTDRTSIYESKSTNRLVRILKIDIDFVYVEYLKSGTTSWYHVKDFERIFKEF